MKPPDGWSHMGFKCTGENEAQRERITVTRGIQRGIGTLKPLNYEAGVQQGPHFAP